ncbi:GLPGLI family protein [Pedobacter jeongneungensis]|uniref:GLPGLI family protein n=1 Tax=Pedobacter jeongneungensis TaxID=947309 RepID=UPI00046AFB03|nr:GLPGLI family protein [Pedobacter jeongneungensis]
MNHIKKTFLALFVLIPILSFAQEKDLVVAKAYYKFTHIRDTINLSRTVEDNMLLLLGKTSTAYKSYTKMAHDSIMLANMEKMKKTQISSPGQSGTGTQIYVYQKQKKAFQLDPLIKDYYYEIKYPVIKWSIKSDTTTISGLKCQKATGTWGGRIYDAWFCPDLPFNAGPWKLRGLPGLIVAASDRKKQVVFEFTGFTKSDKKDAYIEPPVGYIATNEKQYNKMHEAFLNDPIAYMKSVMPEIKSIVPPSKYVRKPPINNPMELPEK